MGIPIESKPQKRKTRKERLEASKFEGRKKLYLSALVPEKKTGRIAYALRRLFGNE